MTLVQPYEYNYCIVSNNSVNDGSDKKKIGEKHHSKGAKHKCGQSLGQCIPLPATEDLENINHSERYFSNVTV